MNILLTGAQGQFARCFLDRCSAHPVEALGRAQLDISDAAAVDKLLAQLQPDIVINGAAYTAVDRAETESSVAFAVNGIGPANLARSCARLAIPLIHLSTDYVFDGQAKTPYLPNAPVNPLGVYGHSKWQGEQAVRQTQPQHLVIRTAWVFSEYGQNFVKTMLRLGSERSELSVVDDQVGGPTDAGQLADVVLELVNRIEQGGFSQWGTYHCAGHPVVSWYQFANAVFAKAQQLGGLGQPPEVHPIPSSAYPAPAARPHYSVLDSTSLESLLGQDYKMDWRIGLERVLLALLA